MCTVIPNPDPRHPAGLPESALELAAQAARAEGHEGATPEAGPWSFGLDFPSYFPVMTHAKNRCDTLASGVGHVVGFGFWIFPSRPTSRS